MFFHMVYISGQIFLPSCHNSRVWRTDGQTDRQTEFSSLNRVCIPCSAVKTYVTLFQSSVSSGKKVKGSFVRCRHLYLFICLFITHTCSTM